MEQRLDTNREPLVHLIIWILPMAILISSKIGLCCSKRSEALGQISLGLWPNEKKLCPTLLLSCLLSLTYGRGALRPS